MNDFKQQKKLRKIKDKLDKRFEFLWDNKVGYIDACHMCSLGLNSLSGIKHLKKSNLYFNKHTKKEFLRFMIEGFEYYMLYNTNRGISKEYLLRILKVLKHEKIFFNIPILNAPFLIDVPKYDICIVIAPVEVDVNEAC